VALVITQRTSLLHQELLLTSEPFSLGVVMCFCDFRIISSQCGV
jgi:hypothetical protein